MKHLRELVKTSQEDEAKRFSIIALLQPALRTFLETCKHEKLKLRELTIYPYQLINIYISGQLRPYFIKGLQKYDKHADFKSSSKWYPVVANTILLLETINLDLASPIT